MNLVLKTEVFKLHEFVNKLLYTIVPLKTRKVL